MGKRQHKALSLRVFVNDGVFGLFGWEGLGVLGDRLGEADRGFSTQYACYRWGNPYPYGWDTVPQLVRGWLVHTGRGLVRGFGMSGADIAGINLTNDIAQPVG